MNSWINVKERLPEKPIPVIVFGVNSNGRDRIIRAVYAREFELEANGDYMDVDWAEYSEEKDQYFAPEGWYEWNEEEEIHYSVSFPITHWMPLPEAPK